MRAIALAWVVLSGCPKQAAPVPSPERVLSSPERLPSSPERILSAMSLPDRVPAVGDRTAPVTIMMVSDFACPHCTTAWEVLVPGVDARPDVQLRVVPFPLSSFCNVGAHDQLRCDLAMAAGCADAQGRFREAASALFAATDAETLASLPALAGLDAAAWAACLADPATLAQLKVDAGEMSRAGVEGVPTFWVFRGDSGGVRLPSSSPEEALAEADRLRR